MIIIRKCLFNGSTKGSVAFLAPLEAILFDIDGTLCDSDPQHYDAFRLMLQEVYELSTFFLHKDWIMEQWEKNYYISSIVGATNGSSLVVMSEGTPYTEQSYKVSESFLYKWINKKWKEGFHVTSMTTAGN
ncbi:casein kinase 1-like protein HD16 isoform X1 [Cannabis sativa]|uniref:casein kinase 1-like protein HD16 isoform X1 n=1 Tax=Cannabis sativa TaxID=3483 RepID=UPI0029CAAB42|nr:casein kinase 1-like protein HD16 isoform X1 [Cannabis sativa]